MPETGQKVSSKTHHDIYSVYDALTQVDSWYHHSDTYDSKFCLISSSYEECRAECVGLHLCLSPDVLKYVLVSVMRLKCTTYLFIKDN